MPTSKRTQELTGQRPYLAEVLADGQLNFARESGESMGNRVFEIRVLPGAILDARFCLEGEGGAIRFGHCIAVALTPKPSSAWPPEQAGLITLTPEFWDEFEPYHSANWRITGVLHKKGNEVIDRLGGADPNDASPGREGLHLITKSLAGEERLFYLEPSSGTGCPAHECIEVHEHTEEISPAILAYLKRIKEAKQETTLTDNW